jgi:hypothetical protein
VHESSQKRNETYAVKVRIMYSCLTKEVWSAKNKNHREEAGNV